MAGAEPDASKMTKLLKEVSSNSFDIGSRTWVYVTHIESPENFHVRPKVYSKYLSELETPDSKSSPTGLQVGSSIIFKSKTAKKYVRGQIYFKEDDEKLYSILAIDYGFLEQNVPCKKVYEPKNDAPIPPLATNCQLAECKPIEKEWSKDSIDTMKYYIGTEPAVVTVKGVEREKLTVQLENSLDDIARLMVLTDYSCLGYECNEVNRFEAPGQERLYYKYCNINPDETIHVRVLSGESLKSFYVAEVSGYKEYVKGKQELTNYMRRSNPLSIEDLKVGTPVGAIYDVQSCQYGRGLITKIIEPEIKAEVLFIDLGITKVLDVSNMVQLGHFFCDKPALAILCSAEENQVWDNSLPKFLYLGYEFDIVVKEVGHKMETPHIVQLIKRDKY